MEVLPITMTTLDMKFHINISKCLCLLYFKNMLVR